MESFRKQLHTKKHVEALRYIDAVRDAVVIQNLHQPFRMKQLHTIVIVSSFLTTVLKIIWQ